MTPLDPACGYSDGDVDTNDTTTPSLETLADNRFSRRQTIMGGAKATGMALMGTAMLAACDDDDTGSDAGIIVNAGTNAATSAGRVVTLTGTVVAGSASSTTWVQTDGPDVELTLDGTTATFLAPAVEEATDLEFTFIATTSDGIERKAVTYVRVSPAVLGFTAVEHSLADTVVVPTGYSVTVMTRLGDPLTAATSAYANDGTDTDFANRIGDHADALHYFGLSAAGAPDDMANTRGLMVQNHENITEEYLHPAGPTTIGGARPLDEVRKEIECHGVSVAEYVDSGNRTWSYVQDSSFNRRITPNTPMTLSGPAAGSAWMRTAYSANGTSGRGTINNCANGISAWHTNLTCEENWAGYFRRDSGDDANRTPAQLTSLQRYGVRSTNGNYRWSSASTTDTTITRWNATILGADATEDFRNEPFQFGWVVEIDPYDPTSTPRKRTALGRFGHEGAFVRAVAGQPVGAYMGDDSRGEYLYKYVSNANWNAGDADNADRLAVGDKYLDHGTLYVARFNADGTGEWLPLVFGQVPPRPASGSYPAYTFADQADILINPRLAADALGATPMDRPEWTAGNPVTGEIYLTLTNSNNSNRPVDGTNAANPRSYWNSGNPNGHIVRLREDGDTTAARTFAWDIYMFGADTLDCDTAFEQTNINISDLDTSNDFSSPDGAYFSRESAVSGQFNPVFWIQTDDGAMTDVTNCMMLAAMPGTVGDGNAFTVTNTDGAQTTTQGTHVGALATPASLRRFLVGPVECEITGVDMTPDGRTLFVGIQHPGERGDAGNVTSHWPESQTNASATSRPRSAVVAITKDDGGVIAL
ncbi:PhoX family protein [Novosphingobium decolorationis]|uniref:PhoX family phosphatase n=1 Tax=Novosphingobium decolorationis TaxID=2698673 RepID=A0ABX8E4Q7_9SPHN|nr:PhoX family phosphatase [Novosphingobium decolorationis]QVM83186.1 PhoX family phosphatase [Novosphingobium decolorationis]